MEKSFIIDIICKIKYIGNENVFGKVEKDNYEIA